MMRTTACDGVIVGRAAWAGRLPRPREVFEGRAPADPPGFGGVVDVMLEHARSLAEWLGDEASPCAPRQSAWYKGFWGAPLRQRLGAGDAPRRVRAALAEVDRAQPSRPTRVRVPREDGGRQKVAPPAAT
jgi:hypothetical protein